MNNVQLRVGDLLYAAFKRWKMILALGLLGFICGFALSGVSYLQGNYTSYEISCSIAITSYNKIVVFIDRSPAECYNSFRVLWIGEALLPQRRFLGGSNHSFFVEMLIS